MRDKDTLVAVNGESLLFNSGVAYIAGQNLAERSQKLFELPRLKDNSSVGPSEEESDIASKKIAPFNHSNINTIGQFLIFRNLSL